MKRFKNKRYIIGAAVILLSIFSYLVYSRSSSNAALELFKVSRGMVKSEVVVTGKVTPVKTITLGFERTGTVRGVYTSIGSRVGSGQVLASLNNSELLASLREREASVAREEAKLSELKSGTRSEDLDVQRVKVANALSALKESKKSLVEYMRDSYTKSDDAIHNKTDQYFTNPNSSSPVVNLLIGDPALKSKLEFERLELEELFVKWEKIAAELDNPKDDIESYRASTRMYLDKVRTFLNDNATAVNSLQPNSTVTQTIIDTYKTAVSTARTNINTASNSLTTAEQSYEAARSTYSLEESQLNLKLAGSTSEQVAAQEATVNQYKAQADNLRAQIENGLVRAPIFGQVTKVDVEVGEVASAGKSVISMISENNMQIEVQVPEVDIGHIAIGNPVEITLDAFPNEKFSGKVTFVDPAETIVDGVVNFRVIIDFLKAETRMKSGLTANLSIETEKKTNALVVSEYAVIERDDGGYVKKLVGKNVVEKKVVLGLHDRDGMVEILSGLNEGDVVVNVGVKKNGN